MSIGQLQIKKESTLSFGVDMLNQAMQLFQESGNSALAGAFFFYHMYDLQEQCVKLLQEKEEKVVKKQIQIEVSAQHSFKLTNFKKPTWYINVD